MKEERRPVSGFTLTEMLMVVIILVALVGILIPSIRQGRQRARRIECASNLRGIGQALIVYDSEYERVPLAYNDDSLTWQHRLAPYTRSTPVDTSTGGSGTEATGVYKCPVPNEFEYAVAGLAPAHPCWYYMMNQVFLYNLALDSIYDRPKVVFVSDGWEAYGDSYLVSGGHPHTNTYLQGNANYSNSNCVREVHNNGANYLFCDGHVTWLEEPPIVGTNPPDSASEVSAKGQRWWPFTEQ